MERVQSARCRRLTRLGARVRLPTWGTSRLYMNIYIELRANNQRTHYHPALNSGGCIRWALGAYEMGNTSSQLLQPTQVAATESQTSPASRSPAQSHVKRSRDDSGDDSPRETARKRVKHAQETETQLLVPTKVEESDSESESSAGSVEEDLEAEAETPPSTVSEQRSTQHGKLLRANSPEEDDVAVEQSTQDVKAATPNDQPKIVELLDTAVGDTALRHADASNPVAARKSVVKRPKTMHKDGLAISTVGRPGPRKRRKLHSPADGTTHEVPETQLPKEDHGAVPTRADGAFAEPRRPIGMTRVPRARNEADQSQHRLQHRSQAVELQEVAVTDVVKEHQTGAGQHGKPEHVQNWLHNQNSPVMSPSRPPSRKRHADYDFLDDDHDYVDEADGLQRSPAALPHKPGLPAPLRDGPITGMYTNEEKAVADAVFASAARFHRIEESQLKCWTIDWPNVGILKTDIQDCLPNRNKAALRKFCQRRFAPYESGPWTEAQDDVLRKAYATYPNQWVLIGDEVDRTAQACRDRYRSVVQYGSAYENGPWSRDEEVKLAAAVKECIQTIKSSCKDGTYEHDLERLETMISWKTVCEKLGNKRNVKRCREKWQNLKRRDLVDDACNLKTAVAAVAAVENHDDEVVAAAAPAEKFEAQTKRQRAVETKMKQFRPGDFYDVVVEIFKAIEDRTKEFQDESTVWSVVAIRNKGSRFSGALRRRAYYRALEAFSSKNVKNAATIAGKAYGMARSLEKWAEQNGGFKRGYALDVLKKQEKTGAEPLGKPSATRAPTPRPDAAPKKKILSDEYVLNSDDEDDKGNQAVASNGMDAKENRNPAITAPGATRVAATTDEVGLDDSSRSSLDSMSDSASEDEELAMKAQQAREAAQDIAEIVDDLPVSSLNSRYDERYEESLPSPQLSPRTFMARCNGLGRKQHKAYMKQKKKKRQTV